MPAWLLTILFAAGFAGIGVAGYWGLRRFQQPSPTAQAPPKLTFETPGVPPPEVVKAHPIARHIEITGLRLTEDPGRKAAIRFVVVNHSGADIAGLAADVNLVAVTGGREKEPVGTFSFKLPSLGPYESKELKAPLTTKLRVYELPDWQFLRADFRITSP